MIGKGSKSKPKWVQHAVARMKAKGTEGSFSASAAHAGESTQEYAREVLNNPKASPLLRKRANFARNAAGFKH